MYQGQVKKEIIGYCIYCSCAIYKTEEDEIIYTGLPDCNCTLAVENEED